MLEHTDTLEQAIFRALAGVPMGEVGRIYGLDTHTLQAAIEAYRDAGRHALATVAGTGITGVFRWRVPMLAR